MLNPPLTLSKMSRIRTENNMKQQPRYCQKCRQVMCHQNALIYCTFSVLKFITHLSADSALYTT